MSVRHLSALALALAATLFAGCDSGGPTEVSSLGFARELPRTLVAGDSLRVTARGQSTHPFTSAEVLVFRDLPTSRPGQLLSGDTLFVQRLAIEPGARDFQADAVVVIPDSLITRAVTGWIYIATGNSGSGQQIEIVPAR